MTSKLNNLQAAVHNFTLKIFERLNPNKCGPPQQTVSVICMHMYIVVKTSPSHFARPHVTVQAIFNVNKVLHEAL